MMAKYDVCLCMGRFQPFHYGHLALVQTALDQGERVLILLGSHLSVPSLKNPWSTDERRRMIWPCLTASEQTRVGFVPVCDRDTNEQWATSIHQAVNAVVTADQQIAMVSYHEQGTSFFKQYFPAWTYIEKPRHPTINATDIRAAYFAQAPEAEYQAKVPPYIRQYLREFKQNPRYQTLCCEFQAVSQDNS